MMSDAELDRLVERRERYDADGTCRTCGGYGYISQTPCPECNNGARYFVISPSESLELLELALFQRRLLADMAEDGKAVALMKALREENEVLKERVDVLAEARDRLGESLRLAASARAKAETEASAVRLREYRRRHGGGVNVFE